MSEPADRSLGFVSTAYRLAYSNIEHNPAYEPSGPVREILARYPEDMADMRACPHVGRILAPAFYKPSPDDPPIVIWAAWKPDLLACPACSGVLSLRGDEENYRCDGCGNLTDVITSGSSVIPSEDPGFPSLMMLYGLCAKCARDSKIRPVNPGSPA